ncbi:MAG TPA: adenylate/guanylate cyclase domain-containing protein [Pyrinomonadaceae bacterium]|nr:adenylate/guanylate cyclase domain-containing protein [Pyrinomonadaceae bacterium]
MVEKKSEAAFVMAMDMHGFSGLSESDHDKVIGDLYSQIAGIVKAGGVQKLLDRKTMGDGFIFYFEAVDEAADAAMNLRTLFRESLFWITHKFEKHLSCRIGLHSGQFFRMRDAIEERDALFGQNIITVARLEPVVRLNEVWCTESFRAEALRKKVDQQYKFESLGNCELAKGWTRQAVYALYRDGESRPSPLQAASEHRVINHDNSDKDYPVTYFALIRLKHRSDGIEYLKKQLTKATYEIEAIYDLFGAFDILVRFKAQEELKEKDFSDFLVKGRIIRSKDKIELTEIHFRREEKKKEPIVAMPLGSREYMKAFTYIKSSEILSDSARVHKVLDLARAECGQDSGVVTYYKNRDTLILPIVIRTSDYYALANAVESIEEYVDDEGWDHVSITTYPVQALEEMFPESKAQ